MVWESVCKRLLHLHAWPEHSRTFYGMQIHGHPQLFWRGGGGQDRARGSHLTAANTLPTFRLIQPVGRGGAVHFRPIQPLGGGGGGGGGGGVAVRFQSIQPVGGAHVCSLLLQGGEGGRHSVPKGGGGGGGGGRGHSQICFKGYMCILMTMFSNHVE